MFNWNSQKKAVFLDGAHLMTHPESGRRWQDQEEAHSWWLASEHNPENHSEPEELSELARIVVSDIDGAIRTPSDLEGAELIKITAEAKSVVTVSGALDIQDEDFVMPVIRDDGRRLYFPVKVVDKAFSVQISFNETGQYKLDAASINEEFSQPVFDIKPVVFYILHTQV